MLTRLRATPTFFLRPVELLRHYDRRHLRADLLAGTTLAVILMPQAIAFAVIAGLPPEMGLYTAVVGAIVGGLWGSSDLNHTGPTSALSLLILSSLVTTAAPGTPPFIVQAGLVAVMAGLIQVGMGVARLGILVNFVSDAVIVGFGAGAGILIAVGELRHLFGLDFTSRNMATTLRNIVVHLPATHLPTLALGLATIALILLVERAKPTLPATLVALVGAGMALLLFRLDDTGVRVLGQLPSSLPPLRELPLFDLDLLGDLASGAMAIAAIGLIQTMAVARSLATLRGERLDNNQEFVGQGLANIASGFFSGFACSGSFSRSAVAYRGGAQTSLSAVFSGIFVLVAMLVLAPLGAFLPRTALAGILIIVAYRMIDLKRMARIWKGARGDAAIMIVTLLGTLFLPLQVAVLTGILMALAYYILKTSVPQVVPVVPDDNFRHLVYAPDKPSCPQLAIVEIQGDLYFGAVSHIEETIHRYREKNPRQRFLLLRMDEVHVCDISGIHMLESLLRTYRERGGDLFMTEVHPPVFQFMEATGFAAALGADHFLHRDTALEHLFYRVLDPVVCIYESDVRVFRECQNLPRPDYPIQIAFPPQPTSPVEEIEPTVLWTRLRGAVVPAVIDVREPREFRAGHIPEARSLPLSDMVNGMPELPRDRPLIFVCRSGRRSLRVAALAQSKGYDSVAILKGGMQAWETAALLQAVE